MGKRDIDDYDEEWDSLLEYMNKFGKDSDDDYDFNSEDFEWPDGSSPREKKRKEEDKHPFDLLRRKLL